MNIPQHLLPQTEEDAVDSVNPIINENNQIIKDAVLHWLVYNRIMGHKDSVANLHTALRDVNSEVRDFLEKAYYNSFKNKSFDKLYHYKGNIRQALFCRVCTDARHCLQTH